MLCIWDRDNDPKTAPKLRKCRTCKGTGTIRYPASDHDCHRCQGSGQADYGSRTMPAVFHDGIRVDGSGQGDQ